SGAPARGALTLYPCHGATAAAAVAGSARVRWARWVAANRHDRRLYVVCFQENPVRAADAARAQHPAGLCGTVDCAAPPPHGPLDCGLVAAVRAGPFLA